MSETADWYANRLAAIRGLPAPSPQHQGYPLQQPQQLPQFQQAPPVHPGPTGFQNPQPQQIQPGVGTLTSWDANTGALVADDGHVARIQQIAAEVSSHGGTPQLRANAAGTCPNCGSTRYFSAGAGEGAVVFSKEHGTVKAAPQCQDCNYSDPLGGVQSGGTGGALAGAKPTRTLKARQVVSAARDIVVNVGNAVSPHWVSYEGQGKPRG